MRSSFCFIDSLVNATTSSTPLTATPPSSSTQPVPTPTVTQTPASTSAGSAASVTSSPVHQFTSTGSAASVTSSPVASVAPTEAPRKKSKQANTKHNKGNRTNKQAIKQSTQQQQSNKQTVDQENMKTTICIKITPQMCMFSTYKHKNFKALNGVIVCHWI